MAKPILGILAAGMGSRFGGMKQVTPMGPNGELIIDYTVFDATRAGFEKVVFLIKEEHQELFEEKIGRRARKLLKVDYAFQNTFLAQHPTLERIKPWGTGHAVLSMKDKIDAPFGVVNADDFYGEGTFAQLYKFLSTQETSGREFCMVGFDLANTLTENGSVSRGICEISSEGTLLSVTERTKIQRGPEGIFFEDAAGKTPLSDNAVASLNVWGFTPYIFEELERGFDAFLEEPGRDLTKDEYFLPSAVDHMIHSGDATVRVYRTDEKWYGVTYREDQPLVQQALKKLHEGGKYPKIV